MLGWQTRKEESCFSDRGFIVRREEEKLAYE
jgi:hypothetical protein